MNEALKFLKINNKFYLEIGFMKSISYLLLEIGNKVKNNSLKKTNYTSFVMFLIFYDFLECLLCSKL